MSSGLRNLFKSVDEAEAFSRRARATRMEQLRSKVEPGAIVTIVEPGAIQRKTKPRAIRARLKAPTETDECKAFIAWSKLVRYRGRPLFDRVVKIPNDRGKRSAFTAVMVAIGLRRGFPDYIVLAPMFTGPTLLGGLLLEAKRVGQHKVDPDQESWRDLLREYGYASEICEGSEQMIAAVREYMKLAPPGAWVDTTRGSM